MDRLIDADFDSRLLFNQKTTALLIGISTQAFTKWGIEPAERRGREAFYYWPQVFEERDRRYFETDEGEQEPLSLEYERARHSKEQADKLAIENAAARGEIVYTDHMAEIMGRSFTAFRQKLRAVPNHIAAHLPNQSRAKIHAMATELIDQALHEIANFDPGEHGDDQAAAGSNGKRRNRRSHRGTTP